VPASDAATAVGPAFAPTLAGTHSGLGFDPVADVIRTSSSETEQNLRVDPIDGSLTAVDGSFAFAAGDAHEGTNPSVGVNTVPCSSLDIDASDGTAYVTLSDNGDTHLYTVDLTTGGATLIGLVPVDSEVQGIAVAP